MDIGKIKFKHSSLENYEGIYYIKLNEKNHYDNGFAYGKLLKKANHPAIKDMKKILIELPMFLLFKIFKRRLQKLNIPEEYFEEIEGYSDSTGIGLDSLLFINFFYDVFKKYNFFCSTFIFKNKSMIIGRNTDCVTWIAKLFAKMPKLIVRVSNPGKNTITYLGPPLYVGVTVGFNEKMFLGLHAMEDNKIKRHHQNIFTGILPRIVLERASTINHAEEIIKENLPNYPLNFLVAEFETKKICHFEIEKIGVERIDVNSKYASCTNNFIGKKMKRVNHVKLIGSKLRLKVLNLLLKDKKNVSVDEAIDILKDKRFGIKRIDEGTESLSNDGTFISFVLDKKNNTIYVANGNETPVSLTGKYVKIKL